MKPIALKNHWVKLDSWIVWPAFMESNWDGDTYFVNFEKGSGDYPFHIVRLFGGNTYELSEKDPTLRELAFQARDLVREEFVGRQVEVVTSKLRDKFGRHLGRFRREDGLDLLTMLDNAGLLKPTSWI